MQVVSTERYRVRGAPGGQTTHTSVHGWRTTNSEHTHMQKTLQTFKTHLSSSLSGSMPREVSILPPVHDSTAQHRAHSTQDTDAPHTQHIVGLLNS